MTAGAMTESRISKGRTMIGRGPKIWRAYGAVRTARQAAHRACCLRKEPYAGHHVGSVPDGHWARTTAKQHTDDRSLLRNIDDTTVA